MTCIQVPERTALLIARAKGHTEIVDMLIEEGADPNPKLPSSGSGGDDEEMKAEGVEECSGMSRYCLLS